MNKPLAMDGNQDTMTLIQFGNPQLVTAETELKGGVPQSKHSQSHGFLSNKDKLGSTKKLKTVEKKSSGSKKCEDSKPTQSDQDILNLISPPRQWVENRKKWRQMVSSVPATRTDVLVLRKKMESLLKAKNAHKTGLCVIRRATYNQAFDELIRHVTVNCAERGLILIHVRDDLRHLISHFERIYTSVVSYGIRKTLQALNEQDLLLQKIDKLKYEVDQEKKIYDDMLPHYKRFAERYQKASEQSDKEYQEEYEKMIKKKNQLKFLVEQSIGTKKTPPKIGKDHKPKIQDKMASVPK